jgi:hypothetical protein
MSSLIVLDSAERSGHHLNQPRTVIILGRTVRLVTILQTVSLAWILGIGWLIGELIGIAIGLAIVGLVVGTTPVIATAFAHVGLFVMLPELPTTIAIVQLGLFEVGLVGLLSSDPPASITDNLILPVVVGGLVIGGFWLFTIIGLLEASLILCCAVGGIGYSLHRYERVSLGIVTSDYSPNDSNE